MNDMFLPIEVEELNIFTKMIHKLNPSLKSWNVLGIEVPKKGDANFIFHLYTENGMETETRKIMMSYMLFVSESLIPEI